MNDHPSAITRDASGVRVISQELKGLCDQFRKQDRTRLQTAYEMGKRLVQLKAIVKHGEYGPTLDKIGIPHQRASEWVRVAENWGKVPETGTLEEFLKACSETRYCSDPPPAPPIISSNSDTSEDDEPDEPDALDVRAKAAKSAPKETPPPEPTEPTPPPVPGIPDRLQPLFASVPMIDKTIKRAKLLAKAFREIEQTPAFKAANEGRKHAVYSTTFRTAANALDLIKPLSVCPDGCGTHEPSQDADVCPKCGGKGYLTREDTEAA